MGEVPGVQGVIDEGNRTVRSRRSRGNTQMNAPVVKTDPLIH